MKNEMVFFHIILNILNENFHVLVKTLQKSSFSLDA